jgi:hypothetical protein
MSNSRTDAAIQKAMEYLQEKHHADFTATYGEPGYSDPERGIIFANWNNIPKGLADWLEKQGYSLEWSDEWTTCGNGKAWRTSPDCYQWESSIVLTDDGEMLTRDDSHADVIEALAITHQNQTPGCVPSWVAQMELREEGYSLFAGELESGFHPGQTDDPAKLAKQAFEAGAERVVFRKVENSQFYVRFECWVLMPESEADHA